MSKTSQECKNHESWVRQVIVAHWIFLAIALYFALFTDDIAALAISVTMSVGLYITSLVLDVRHVRWHQKNDGKGQDYDFKP